METPTPNASSPKKKNVEERKKNALGRRRGGFGRRVGGRVGGRARRKVKVGDGIGEREVTEEVTEVTEVGVTRITTSTTTNTTAVQVQVDLKPGGE